MIRRNGLQQSAVASRTLPQAPIIHCNRIAKMKRVIAETIALLFAALGMMITFLLIDVLFPGRDDDRGTEMRNFFIALAIAAIVAVVSHNIACRLLKLLK